MEGPIRMEWWERRSMEVSDVKVGKEMLFMKAFVSVLNKEKVN